MEGLVELFAEKVVGSGIVDVTQVRQIRNTCGEPADIIVFGEALLKHFPDKFEAVQGLLDETADAYTKGERANGDPFEAESAMPEEQVTTSFEASQPAPVKVSKPVPQKPVKPAPQPEASATVQPGNDFTKRPQETVVSAAGIEAGIPDFSSLDPSNREQIASALIGMLLELGGHDFSDLHISGGSRPFGRRFGKLEYIAESPMDDALAEAFGMALISDEQKAYFESCQDYDFAIALDNGRRYRTNLMQHRDGLKITFRLVPEKVLSLEELGFGAHTETIKNLLAYHNGLILVTGPVGCGKTTTLAAMVDELNKTRTDHIISVEDPIEIVHRSDQCSVTQRAVGPHTNSFKSALKGALRQDPDIIVIGEMRDLETIEMAISASETGHLVIGTMHTSDAAMTLNRLLDVFPPAAQSQIRAMVAESLRGVICQRLLPGTSGHSVLASEILIKNMAVSALIRDGKQAGLGNIMETGKREGMILMDACVMELFQGGKISAETARANIQNEIIRRNIT
ncbi:MAG: type IV pilus twitching motility protein PilT [Puniceicoccaceae bacterium]